MSPSIHDIQKIIKQYILDQGFDAVGFCDVRLEADQIQHRTEVLTIEQAGDMDWLWESADLRNHPERIFPEANTAIVVASHLGQFDDIYKGKRASTKETPAHKASIAQYALAQKDYHIWMKKKLKNICRFLQENHDAQSRPYVDTAPIAEKQLAENAGIGWIGKHSNVVSLDFGSKLMLGVILTELDLPKNTRHRDFCGACQRCMDACPTGALHKAYCLDIPKCISYLTIEHKGDIPASLHAKMGNRIFGCDACISACPHNKGAPSVCVDYNNMRPNLKNLSLDMLQTQSDEEFHTLFAGTPIKRTGYQRMQRNILIAKGNNT